MGYYRRMSLKGLAEETLAIVDRGGYQAPSGARVELRAELDRAITGTKLYRPDELARLLGERQRLAAGLAHGPARIELTAETTSEAVRRLTL